MNLNNARELLCLNFPAIRVRDKFSLVALHFVIKNESNNRNLLPLNKIVSRAIEIDVVGRKLSQKASCNLHSCFAVLSDKQLLVRKI